MKYENAIIKLKFKKEQLEEKKRILLEIEEEKEKMILINHSSMFYSYNKEGMTNIK